jgi:hypothetical protein
MRRLSPLLCLLTACSATKGLHDLRDSVDCALGCGLANAAGVCGQSGCEIAACNDGFADCNGQLSDGCEVDVDTDPMNCTLCGNVCDSGVCRQGSCQDVNVVAGPSGDGREVTDFVVDPSGVYFVVAAGPGALPDAGTLAAVSLMFVADPHGPLVGLAVTGDYAATLAESEERLCWLVRASSSVPSPYRLESLPKTGGAPILLGSGDQQVAGPVVLERYVYWLTGGLSVAGTPAPDGGLSYEWSDQTLHRALVTGGTDETLATWTKPDLVSLLTAGSGLLVLARGTLVDADAGMPRLTAHGLFSFDPASRAQVQIASDTPYPAVLKDGIAYWVVAGTVVGTGVASPSSLVSVPLSGGTPTTLWTSNTRTVAAEVAVTDRYFFLTVAVARPGASAQSNTYFNGILRIDRSSGQEILVAKRDAPPSHALVDAEYVYWLESGQVLRARQTATPAADGG